MLATILPVILSVVTVIFLFSFTIFVHELGHFLLARMCGMTVDAFAVGMGPAFWKRKINGVEYKLCLFPIGGYVALPQMDPSGSPDIRDDDDRNLPPAKPLAKIVVGLAGVTFNMIFAILLAYIIFWQSKAIAPEYESSAIGYVETNSAAYASGIRIGDSIAAIGGEKVSTWEQFMVVAALNETVNLDLVRHSGEAYSVTLETEKITGGRLVPGVYPQNYCVVLNFLAESPAREAGMEKGDQIIALDGQKLYSREHMIELINAKEGAPVDLEIKRGEETLTVTVAPEFNEEHKRAMIGIGFRTDEVKKPWDQIKSHATLIFRILKALVTPSESKAAAQAIGGPVAIIDIFLQFASMGFMQALWFTCLLNVNLAVMNLLPIPVLDGGHILFSLYELITRRTAPAKLVKVLWNASVIFLLSVLLLLTYRDFARIFAGSKPDQDDAPVENVESVPGKPAEETAP